MIEFRNLTKKFGRFLAVDDVSFEIQRGQTFAILGPNGSGKTTMLKCLAGLVAPTAGQAYINGLDVWENPIKARRLMSYLPQRVAFPESLTGREVMEFYCRLRKIHPRRVDEMLGETRFDFNGFVHRRIGEFSGGMAQRLGLAVACLPDAPVLVLDEPTVSLDPQGAIGFREYLLYLKKQGKTLLLTSHMLADVEQLADRVAILVGGKVVALESIEALRDDLMYAGKMRVVLRHADARAAQAAKQAGAANVTMEGRTMVITAGPQHRLEILRAMESAGAVIDRFDTQEPSLEDTYLRYIHENAS